MRIVGQRLLPPLPVRRGDLEIALALQPQHRHRPERADVGDRIDLFDRAPIGGGYVQWRIAARDLATAADLGHAALELGQRRLPLRRRWMFLAQQVAVLLDQQIQQRSRRRRPQHDAGGLAGAACDAGGEHAALTVAHDHDARRVDAGRARQRRHRGDGVVGGLVVHGEPLVDAPGKALRQGEGALVVAQHRDALRGKPAGDVEERTVRADGLVAVLRARAVHQDHRRERTLACRQGQRARQRTDRKRLFAEAGVGGGRRRRRRWCGSEQQAGDLAVRVDRHMRQQCATLELQALFDHAQPVLLAFAGRAALLQRAQLRGQRVPGLGQLFGWHRLGHRRGELGLDRGQVAGLQAIQQRAGSLLRRRGQHRERSEQRRQCKRKNPMRAHVRAPA
ncbi:hypothetical protein NB717_003029 [Xanthomonas sacchari]|nr:hypothetical protein [Xanthomonas sacchari]